MNSQDYLKWVSMIIENQLTLEGFIQLNGVDQAGVEDELARLTPVAYTMNVEISKPIYFFKASNYPNLGHLFHCSKLFRFAMGGSPYKDGAISGYDIREEHPYVQVGIYDPERKVFLAGLRYLPLYKGIPFGMSAMHPLFKPVAYFTKHFLPQALELGQTFILPDIGTSGGHYLFSAMATMILLNPDARYLCGKPTIEGNISDVSKEIVASFALDSFNPRENDLLNPYGKDLFEAAEDVVMPALRSFETIIQQYNSDTGSEIKYKTTTPISQKRKFASQMLFYYSAALPPMFKFYSLLTEEKGMICLCSSVINPTYTTGAWEFPLLMDKTKIASIHNNFLVHYADILKDAVIDY